MLDIYYVGTATRLAAEAPIPIVRVVGMPLEMLGGAGNVAVNIKALGGTPVMSAPEHRDMPIKNRVICANVEICRFDVNDTCKPMWGKELDNVITEYKPDAIIISDYNKGTIQEEALEVISGLTPEKLYIDTKRNPTLFPQGATFFPNNAEFAEFWREYTGVARTIHKKGDEGADLLAEGQLVDTCPALSHNVVNVTGAGDTVIAAFTVCETEELHANPLFFSMAAASLSVETCFTGAPNLKDIEERLRAPQNFKELQNAQR